MKKINILGYEYNLDFSKTYEQSIGNVGFCSFKDKTISVANDIESDLFNSTLIHEIIEALNYHLELDLKHNQIMGIEVGIHQVLNDAGVDLNPLKEK